MNWQDALTTKQQEISGLESQLLLNSQTKWPAGSPKIRSCPRSPTILTVLRFDSRLRTISIGTPGLTSPIFTYSLPRSMHTAAKTAFAAGKNARIARNPQDSSISTAAKNQIIFGEDNYQNDQTCRKPGCEFF